MPPAKKYEPKRRSRPRTGEETAIVNWRLPLSQVAKLDAYATTHKRSEAWVICDLIDTLPSSLVAVEESHERARLRLPPL